ncbi:uncharacterized protein LOC112639877 [Camponotus floridanus]|uniref:uncharacterized protein LOC112639877 n=1 Tax=Camponotus floridanus TaxID=104421 RepID=UPI000DC67D3B|nr:uncharacterized protein LOC112639877 [Camponotus floridanus]
MVFSTLSASSKLLMIVAESDVARRGGDMATSDIFKIIKRIRNHLKKIAIVSSTGCASRSCEDYRGWIILGDIKHGERLRGSRQRVLLRAPVGRSGSEVTMPWTPRGHKRGLSRAEKAERGTLFTILHL